MMRDRRTTQAKPLPILWAAVIAFATLMLSPAQAQIVLYVTGQPITAYDIEQRSKLIALSTGKSKSRQEVIDDLIDDRLKIMAAKRFNFELSQADVDNAFASMARSSG